MRRSGRFFKHAFGMLGVTIAVVGAALAYPAAPASAALAYPRARSSTEATLAGQFLTLVNSERAARGLAPFAASPDVNDLYGAYRAQYTHDMCASSCHVRPANELEYLTLLPAGWSWAGEVSFGHLPAGDYAIGDAVRGFMSSGPHRNTLMVSTSDLALSTGVVCRGGEMTVVANVLRRTTAPLPAVTASSASPVVTTPRAGGECGWKRHWVATANGAVLARGGAANLGGISHVALSKPIVDMEPTPSRNGYWLLGGDGGVFTFGDAAFYGSTGAMRLNQPVVAMAATPTGRGYWFVAADGGVFTFGDAGFYGSTGSMRLNAPVVGMAAAPDGRGYWLVTSDGGIFTFGSATFLGSMGATRLARAVTAMLPALAGVGYSMVAADGGMFTFGAFPFFGATPGVGDIVGAAAVPGGYYMASATGRIVGFGDALVSAADSVIAIGSPVVDVAA